MNSKHLGVAGVIKANQQRGLWECIGSLQAQVLDKTNMLGPYKLSPDAEEIPRHLDCSNYDLCLGFAAKENWKSFSCEGCRKTSHGKFAEERFRR